MTKRLRISILLLLVATLAVAVLASCTSVGVLNVQVKEDCSYKTEYVIGEELDLTGLELVVTRTDGEAYTVKATEVRQDLKILNFKTDKVANDLVVVLEYKGVSTSIIVNVTSAEDASTKYTVSFNTGKGSDVESVGAVEFGSISKPEDPVYDGYVFDGWYKEPTFDTLWDFNTDKVERDTTLYAKWAKLYTITFINESILDEEGAPTVITKTVKAGDDLVDVPAVTLIDGKVGSWSQSIFTEITSDMTVYAVYKDATYTVEFYYIEEDGVTRNVLYTFREVKHGTNLQEEQAEIIASINVPQIIGHKHFDRWSQDFNYVTSNLSICALYVTNAYDVTFSLNYEGAESSYDFIEGVTYNNPVEKPELDPEREGYAFDGWYKNAECSTGSQWNFNVDRVKGNTTIYAKWIKLYSVKFLVDVNDTIDEELTEKVMVGEKEYYLYELVEVKEGVDVSLIATPAKQGYSAKWDKEAIELLAIKTDVNVIAKFTINTYTVTFFNFDRTELKKEVVEYKSSATAPESDPIRVGYSFTGWDKEFNVIISDLEVTALFEANEYVVNVHPNNGLQPYTITATYDSRIDLATPNYNGYHFVGWYKDNAYQEKWDISKDVFTTAKDGDLSLYAYWLKIHTVEFLNEALFLEDYREVIDGNLVEDIPAFKEIEGKNGAWYERSQEGVISSDPFDFNTTIRSDVTLVLQYTTKIYKVTFYKDIGQYHYDLSIEHGSSIIASDKNVDDPVVEGKTFVKWDKPLDYVIVEDTDFLAEYETIYFTVTWGQGSDVTSKVAYGKPASFPVDSYELPTKVGNSLSGWVMVSHCGEQDCKGSNEQSVKCDMVVDPVWTPNVYTVEFRNRETNSVYSQMVDGVEQQDQKKQFGQFIDVNTTVSSETTEEIGKRFIGWDIDLLSVGYDCITSRWTLNNSFGGEKGVFDLSVDASLVIRGDEIYYVTENVNTLVNSLNYNWDILAKSKLVQTEEGWKVGGNVITTYETISFGAHFYYSIQGDTTFFSKHEVLVFTVDYVTNTSDIEIESESYEYNALSLEPTLGNRSDYVFLGWYEDALFTKKHVFGTPITSDITLYARWEETELGSACLHYELNELGTAYSLTSFGNVEAHEIPQKIEVANYYNGLPVEAIGAEAFANVALNGNVQTIILPNTLRKIGPGAFMNMPALKEITIPEGVTIIPDNAFNGATALEKVVFGDYSQVTTIGKNAFARNINLKYSEVNGNQVAFTLPQTLTSIDSGAFYGALALNEITFPEALLSIGDNAFAGANNLRYVVFEREYPLNLGANVFQNYTSLANAFRIYVPEVAVARYKGASANANWQLLGDKITSLSNVTDDGVWSYVLNTAGRAELAQYLGKATSVSIPETIRSKAGDIITVDGLGNYVFDGNVTDVKLLSDVTISEFTFNSADNLTKIIVSVTDVNLINANYLSNAYVSVTALDTLAVSSTITVSELFGGSAPTSLLKVETLDTDDSIIAGFLANCVYVQQVVINGKIKEIGDNAFLNCTALTEVIFDNSEYSLLTNVGTNAFSGAISLEGFKVDDGTSVVEGLPNSVTTIGEGAFDGTKWLNANASDLVVIGNGILYRYRGSEAVIEIGEEITSITAGAFKGNANLRQVYVLNPESALLKEIGISAFENCVNLESVVLPASLTKIGEKAFAGNTKLQTIVLFGANKKAPSLYGNLNDGTHSFANTRQSVDVYVDETLDVTSWGYTFNYVTVAGLALNVGNTADENWVYANAFGGTGIILIKSLSAGESLVVPETVGTRPVYEMANYALPRTLKALAYSTRILNVGEATFAGVTFLEELTIYNDVVGGAHRVEAGALMTLFTQNSGIKVLNTISERSISALIGGTLPENVKKVNILEGETAVAGSFLENNSYVEEITVTIDGVVYNLEDTASITNSTFTSVGVKAFRGTKWMDNLSDEFVIILGGNLVDYKGTNPVIDIPATVKEINGGLFENDNFVEVVFVPESVTAVGNRAFYGATKLTKVFFSSTTAPSLQNQSFDANAINQRGIEVYVPQSAYSAYLSAQNWSNAKPVSDEGVVRVKKEMERKGNKATYVEYVFQVVGSGAKLLLSRNYTETTENGKVTIEESLSAVVPESLTDGTNSYGVTEVGNNVFMSEVTKISFSLLNTINEFSFKNLGDLDVITITGVENASNLTWRKVDGATLINLFNAHSARTIEYNGTVVLSDLLDTTDPSLYTSLSAVKISEGVTETVAEMLKGWSAIEEITFPASIVKVGINSLEDTAWYKNYNSQVFGDFVVLGGSLLYKYKGIAGGTIRVPDQIAIVNTGAFSNYDGAEWKSNVSASEISFSENSKAHTILDYAFAGLKKLANVGLPASMRRVADNAFEGTLITAENDMLVALGSVAKEGSTLIKYYGSASTFVIPHMVKKISANAFAGNTSLTEITYDYVNGSILTTICEDAFNGAQNLVTVNLPSTVKNIGKDAFFNTKWFANKLAENKDVVIGGVLYQKVAYTIDRGFSTYELRPGITSITEGALVKMDKTFEIDGVTYGVTDDNVTATKLIIYPGVSIPQEEMYSVMSRVSAVQTNGEVTLSALIGNLEPLENVTTLSFFNDTQSIVAEYAYGWNSVTTVQSIPYSVIAIGERAFAGTEWFENLSGDGIVYAGGETGSSVILKYLGDEENVEIRYANGIAPDAFRGNETIKSVTFLESAGITEIPAFSFMDCVNLASVTLNDNIVKFGEKAFENTAWLNNYESDFVIIDGAVIAYVGDGGQVTIPKEAKKIYDYVFRGNETITSVVFDENCLIDTIEANLFRDCVNLENITLSEHITHVERSALSGTLWLEQASQGTNPILTYENVYYGVKRIVLYVGSNQTYRITADITEIVPTAFSGVTSLSQLVFAEGKLNSIPDNAFEGCTSLTTVTMVPTIVSIGANAFAGTPWYATQSAEFVVVNGTLIKYNGSATSVVLPETISQIESGIFSGKSIVSLDMSATSIEEIPAGAFKGVATLSDVILSANTKVIGRGAFEGTQFFANASQEFVILNGVLVKYNGASNFVYLPEEVKVIATDAFYGNVDLAGIVFSSEVTILEEAFVGTSLTTVDGEEYVVAMALNAFEGTVYANPVNDFAVVNGTIVKYEGNAEKVVIPENVTYIPEGIFSGNETITELDFSLVSGALEIAPNAFRNAINLRSIVFSDNINRVGTRAFYNTKWAEEYASDVIVSPSGKLLAYIGEGTIVNIPANVVAFADGVFSGNVNITTVQFAQGAMVTIPEYAFKDCTALLNVTFPRVAFEIGKGAFENTAWLRRQNDYVVVNGMLIAYKGTKTDIEIPATVTKIYDYVFKGNEQITSLSFASGSTLTAITGETFVGCSSLSEVSFRSTIEHLDMGAFEGTAWKTNFEGDFVIVNGKLLAYLGSSSNVIIPGTVTQIAENAFKGNLNIISLAFDLSSYLDTIPQRAFEGCTYLETVTFPESIREIGKDAFKGTKWLQNLENSLTESDAGCYVYKGRLLIFVGGTEDDTAITLPEGVTSISKNAFVGSGVTRIYIRESVTDPSSIALEEGALDEISSIVIADAYIDAFRTHPNWSKYVLKMIPASER